MKTSNKLLLGLLTVIVISMIFGNIMLKKRLKDQVKIESKIDSISQPAAISRDSISLHINMP